MEAERRTDETRDKELRLPRLGCCFSKELVLLLSPRFSEGVLGVVAFFCYPYMTYALFVFPFFEPYDASNALPLCMFFFTVL